MLDTWIQNYLNVVFILFFNHNFPRKLYIFLVNLSLANLFKPSEFQVYPSKFIISEKEKKLTKIDEIIKTKNQLHLRGVFTTTSILG